VYVEKYLETPRHVEIQVLADAHGAVLSLGERECSVQRRHQKMIEEAPSVAVDAALRQRMGEATVRVARAAGYVNAGTCEFLLDRDGQFYFLEMNTRIQVEHPVTELVTGIDLVAWQLRIAAGEALPWRQEDVAPCGCAIECRITSEDVANGFLPSTGRISYLRPPNGPGVRWDAGIDVGTEVGLYYDSLLAKLIAWAPTREAAIARMRRALDELLIEGVETSRELHARILDDPEFRGGAIDIHWLERRLPSLTAPATSRDRITVAAIAGALLAAQPARRRSAELRAVTTNGRSNSAAANGGAQPQSPQSDSRDSAWKIAARRDALREG